MPDLEGFELRPYVSYAGAGPQKIPAVGVPPMTPEELLAGAAAADSKLHAKTETDQVEKVVGRIFYVGMRAHATLCCNALG